MQLLFSFSGQSAKSETPEQEQAPSFKSTVTRAATTESRTFDSYRSTVVGNPWTPGIISRAPWKGLAALVGTFMVTLFGLVFLYYIDGLPINSFTGPAQPTVIVALAGTLAGMTLTFALSVGVDISFWKAAQRGTTLYTLHQYWVSGSAFWGAVRGLTSTPAVSVATILTIFSLLQGTLLQRSIAVTEIWLPRNQTFNVSAARELPVGYSGFVSGSDTKTSMVTHEFGQVLGQFNNFKYKPVPLKHPECGPKCTGTLEGFGFQTACKRTYEPFDVASSPNGTIVFATDVDFEESTSDASIMYVNSLWKGTGQCDGVLGVDTCTLSAGVVSYPVIYAPNNTVQLASDSAAKDVFLRRVTMAPAGPGQATTLGGIAFAMSAFYKSSVNMSYSNSTSGYVLETKGTTGAIINTTLITLDPLYTSSCNLSWYSPTYDFQTQVRLLAFQASVLAAQQKPHDDYVQQVSVRGGSYATVFKVSYSYAALGASLSLAGIIAVFITFWSWWELGRTVSMSPIEIAKAFDAPLLEHVDCNAPATTMLKQIGEGKVRYGDVGLSAGRPIDPLLGGGFGAVRRRLEIFDANFTASPIRGGDYHPTSPLPPLDGMDKKTHEDDEDRIDMVDLGPTFYSSSKDDEDKQSRYSRA